MEVRLKYTRAIFDYGSVNFSRFLSFGFGNSDIFTCTQIDLRVVLCYHVEFAELMVIENINYKL